MAQSLRRKLKLINRAKALSAEERARLILDERTERLAARDDEKAAPEAEAARVLVCGAGSENFGVPVEAVAEVLPSQECVPVPDGPQALLGVFGRNGRLVSVIDLAAALGMPPSGSDDEGGHFVLLRNEQPQVALRVDRALAVSAVAPLTDEAGGFRSEAVTGYAKAESGLADQDRILSLLDTDRLLRPFLPSSPVPGV
ncbi:chemotaxis protein CheW [Microvirga roseola]|uniref:chemotaxis protein CheW n=1 Tax=Microvirga roseola TaxID=2883126 RepID=UPI001E4518FC|nr:chemotaxis protein CheW [Microvirga roseola]